MPENKPNVPPVETPPEEAPKTTPGTKIPAGPVMPGVDVTTGSPVKETPPVTPGDEAPPQPPA